MSSPSPMEMSILVVDDDDFVRNMLVKSLCRHGFTVHDAANGHDAVDFYTRHHDEIAVVLLDVQRPGLDGPATFEQLRALNVDVCVCFMSGNPGAFLPDELLRGGASRFFEKPFDVNELIEVFHAFISRRGPPT